MPRLQIPVDDHMSTKIITLIITIFLALVQCVAANGDPFVAWGKTANDADQRDHRVYPVSGDLRDLADH